MLTTLKMALFAPMPKASAIDRDGGKARVLPEHTRAVTKVVLQVSQHPKPPRRARHDRLKAHGALDAAQALRQQVALGQLLQRRAVSLLGPSAAAPRLLETVFEVLRKLLHYLRLPRRTEPETREPSSDFRIPVRHFPCP